MWTKFVALISPLFATKKGRTFLGSLAIALSVGGVVYAGYQFFKDMQDHIIEQEVKLVEQNLLITELSNTVTQTREDFEEMVKNLDELDQALSQAETDVDELTEIFLDHNLTNLSYERPGLIERRINEATDEVLDDFRRLTIPGSLRNQPE